MAKFRLLVRLLVVATMFVAASSQLPASAYPGRSAAAGQDDVGILEVGTSTQLLVDGAYLFQCPAVNCNIGHAYRHSNLRTFCKLPLHNTYEWNLVLNLDRGSNHVGFISSQYLAYSSPEVCGDYGRGTGVTVPAWLFQCTWDKCNHGNAYPGNDVATICFLPLSESHNWNLVLNHANNHVGFISTQYLSPREAIHQCGG